MKWLVKVPDDTSLRGVDVVVHEAVSHWVTDAGALILYGLVSAAEPDRIVRVYAPGRWIEAWPQQSATEETKP